MSRILLVLCEWRQTILFELVLWLLEDSSGWDYFDVVRMYKVLYPILILYCLRTTWTADIAIVDWNHRTVPNVFITSCIDWECFVIHILPCFHSSEPNMPQEDNQMSMETYLATPLAETFGKKPQKNPGNLINRWQGILSGKIWRKHPWIHFLICRWYKPVPWSYTWQTGCHKRHSVSSNK